MDGVVLGDMIMLQLMPIPVLVDFAGSISILIVLAVAFGAIRRRVSRGTIAQAIQGALFGSVAVLQMFAPLEPMSGLIIDLRNIPIALAGAFLGWRGLAICLLIATSVRAGVGGVGADAGILAMAIAGSAGAMWSRIFANRRSRGWISLYFLAIGMSSHLAAALILPPDIARWFFSEAALSILLLNLFCVPIVGFFLSRELQMIENEQRLEEAARIDPETGLLNGRAFQQELNLKLAASPLGTVSGLMVVRLRHNDFVSATWGQTVTTFVLGALKHRIEELRPEISIFGVTKDHRLVVPLSRYDVIDVNDFSTQIQRLAIAEAFNLPNGQRASVSVDVDILEMEKLSEFQAALTGLFPSTATTLTARSQSRTPWWLRYFQSKRDRAHAGMSEKQGSKEETVLFQKADLLFASRSNTA